MTQKFLGIVGTQVTEITDASVSTVTGAAPVGQHRILFLAIGWALAPILSALLRR